MALIGVLAEPRAVNLTPVLMHNIRVQGILTGSYQLFKEYLAFLEEHRLEIPIGAVFHGLEQAPDAFRMMKDGGHWGKIVIELDEPYTS